MSVEVRIEDNEDIVRSDLGRIMSRIPKVEEEFAEELMKIAVDEIRRSAKDEFNKFNGNMREQISMDNVDTTPSAEGAQLTLSMTGNTPRDADYLEWHERATSGHFVEVSRDNKPIQEWVKQEYDQGDNPSYLYVEPTPFVKPAVQRIARRARKKANSEDNAIAELAREA